MITQWQCYFDKNGKSAPFGGSILREKCLVAIPITPDKLRQQSLYRLLLSKRQLTGVVLTHHDLLNLAENLDGKLELKAKYTHTDGIEIVASWLGETVTIRISYLAKIKMSTTKKTKAIVKHILRAMNRTGFRRTIDLISNRPLSHAEIQHGIELAKNITEDI